MNNPFYTGYDTPENAPQSFTPPPPPPPMPPLSSSIPGFVRRHSISLLIAHILLLAAAVTVSVIYFMPVPNPLYHPPRVTTPNYTTAIGLIPLALSHIIAVIAEHMISRSSEDKQKLSRALILFAVSRLMHIASWAFIFLAPDAYGILSGKRVNIAISLSNIAGFIFGALFVAGADIPLFVLALSARKTIRKDNTERDLSSWGILLSVTVIISFIVSSFFSLVFFFSALTGDRALMIISPLYLIGMIAINIVLSKLSNIIRIQKVTVRPSPMQQTPVQQTPMQQTPVQQTPVQQPIAQQSIVPPSIIPQSLVQPPAVQLSKGQQVCEPPAAPVSAPPAEDICKKIGETLSDLAGRFAAGHLVLGIALIVISVMLVISSFTPSMHLPSMALEGASIIFCGIAHFIMLFSLQRMINSKHSKEAMLKALNMYLMARLIHLIPWAFLVIYPFIAAGIIGVTSFSSLFVPFIVPVVQDASLLSLAISAKKSIQNDLPVIRDRGSAEFAMITSVLVCLATAYFSMYFIFMAAAGIPYVIIGLIGIGCAFAVILYCLGIIRLTNIVLTQKG